MNKNTTNLNQKSKSKFVLSICIFVFLCLLWLIAFFKVPVVGKLIDAIFFEFLFGQIKFIIYAWLAIMLITWYKKDYFYSLFSKRKICSYILITFALCMFAGIGTYYMNGQWNTAFTKFFKDSEHAFFDNWYADNLQNLFDFKSAFLAYNNYALGGLIGVVYVASLNQFAMFLIFFIYLAITIFISILCYSDKILNKIKNKLIKFCGGFSSKEIKIINKKMIDINDKTNEQKRYVVEQLNLDENDVEINNEQIIININKIEEIQNIIHLIEQLKIRNIKIKFNDNEIDFSKE